VIIVDTNLLSENIAPVPSVSVVHWFSAQTADDLYTTAITEAEVIYGIERLPRGKRRTLLFEQIERTFTEDFAGRVLSFDQSAARLFGQIRAQREKIGRPMGILDAQIAAIAISNGAALATRNTRDFENCGLKLINPWNYSN
jgi:predicted nucleic acid-binding protein